MNIKIQEIFFLIISSLIEAHLMPVVTSLTGSGLFAHMKLFVLKVQTKRVIRNIVSTLQIHSNSTSYTSVTQRSSLAEPSQTPADMVTCVCFR